MWTAVGVFGLATGVFAAVLALAVYLAGPRRFVNRVVTAFLAAEAGAILFAVAAEHLTDDPAYVYAGAVVGYLAFVVTPFAYLAVVGILDSVLARPFATRTGRVALLVGAVAGMVSVFAARPFWVAGPAGAFVPGPGLPLVLLADVLISLYALATAVMMYRTATSSTARRTAGWFIAAFGARDVLYVVLPLLYLAGVAPWLGVAGIAVAAVVYLPLVAYALLRTQLFDIDLKIKMGLRRGTVAFAFLAVFFIVAQVASEALSARLGIVLGGAAAGLLLFAVAPLQRAAERLADATMPNVRPTSEYVAFRKLEVYRAALEGAYRDGDVTPKEREILTSLVTSLGIASQDAEAMERDVAGRRSPV